MTANYPFHYKVLFKYIAYTPENEVINRTIETVFKDDDPLTNRAKAFEDVEEYLSYLKEHNGVAINNQGNYTIAQPTMIRERIGELRKLNFYSVVTGEYESYKESISIYLVLENEEIAHRIEHLESDENPVLEHLIYKISSQDFDQQEIIDNLEMIELDLYETLDIEVGNLKEVVYHYGVDYAESGEDVESGAKRTILKVPFKWITLESYNEFQTRFNEEHQIDAIDYGSIIARGESNQIEFKPTLVYNFATGKGSIKVKYIIAKVICSFLNSNGGTLFIGVKDDGTVQGLDYDYSLFEAGQKDKILLELDSLISHFFGTAKKPLISGFIEEVAGKEILIIEVSSSQNPIFLLNKRDNNIEKEFYIRMHASTRILEDVEDIVDYIVNQNLR